LVGPENEGEGRGYLVSQPTMCSYVDGEACQPHKVWELGESNAFECRDLSKGQEAKEDDVGLQSILGLLPPPGPGGVKNQQWEDLGGDGSGIEGFIN
jgi:hypothetical protein